MVTGTQRVGILVYDNVTMIDIAGPADVFSHANTFGAHYETVLVSADGRAGEGVERPHAHCRAGSVGGGPARHGGDPRRLRDDHETVRSGADGRRQRR